MKPFVLLAFAFVIWGCPMRDAALASPIQVSASPASVTAGQATTLTVSGVVDAADEIGAFTFVLNYDPGITFVPGSLTLGSILAGWAPLEGSGAGSLAVSIADYPTDIQTPDSNGQSVTLFSVRLATSAAMPTTTQTVTVSPDPNDLGVPCAYQFTTTPGSLTIRAAAQSVPAPGALAVVPALLLLIALRRP